MVPNIFEILDQLPLTINGKVDRKALPPPGRREPDRRYVAPRTKVERQLADVWSEVLQVEKIGIDDDFFESGGHSLLATQIVNRVSETFQVRLPVKAIFDFPTVAGLTQVIAGMLLNRESIEERTRLLEELQTLPDSD
jgi:acyl carrier protein